MGKIIIANWKMNPGSVGEATTLAAAIDEEGLVICPPFPFLEAVGRSIKKSALGTQDIFWEPQGAYTGEVSPRMAKSLGVNFSIIGHSERRLNLGETDGMVNKKVLACLQEGIVPILCIGETKKERDAGKKEEAVTRELQAALQALPESVNKVTIPLIVTYEPVWAISTNNQGGIDDGKDIVEMINLIKGTLRALGRGNNTRIIYGGSVNAENAENLLKFPEIEGALVGGASLKEAEIKKILTIAKQYG
jgi:triosephosphate isomerase